MKNILAKFLIEIRRIGGVITYVRNASGHATDVRSEGIRLL